MSVTYERLEALFLRKTEIITGMMVWVRSGLCPPPSHSTIPWDEIAQEDEVECNAIRDERDLRNLTGEAQR